jgi:hypothetical protein
MPRDIVADVDIARACLRWWLPYQAEVMTGIVLVENGGDRNSFYMNGDGLFAGYADRGLFAINEAVAREMDGPLWPDPRLFRDVEWSAAVAHDIWQWRFSRAAQSGTSYSGCLIAAYSGWSTYSHRDDDSPLGVSLRARWALMRPRAKAAVVAAL